MVTWLGNKICDAGFYINLSDSKNRKERTIKELEKSGFLGVNRFNACKIDDEVYSKYGCTQSHIEIAKLQIKYKWEYVLYLEDDIIYDLFYDHNTDNTKIDIQELSKQIIIDLNTHKPDVLFLGVRPEYHIEKKITNCLLKPNKILMTHAYIGSLKYAEFLVNNLKYYDTNHFSGGYPIDFFISQINVKDDWRLKHFENGEIILNNNLSILMTTPQIFNQGKSFSNLLNCDVDYEEWVRDSYSTYANTLNTKIKKYIHE